jgi:hypothetical protein
MSAPDVGPYHTFIDGVDGMVDFWLNLAHPELSTRERLEGLAHSMLVQLDGASAAGYWELRRVEEDGSVGENITGNLHELYAAGCNPAWGKPIGQMVRERLERERATQQSEQHLRLVTS